MSAQRIASPLISAGLQTLPELLLVIQRIQDLELHDDDDDDCDVSWQPQYHISPIDITVVLHVSSWFNSRW